MEDDPGLQSQLRWCFDDEKVLTAGNKDTALAQLRRCEPQVVTLDLGLPPDPGGSTVGFSLLEEILSLLPRTKIIVITGREEKENAVRAIGMGAYDFYQKPVDADTLKFVVDRAFRLHELETQNLTLKTGQASTSVQNLITSCPQMLSLCRTVERVAPTDATTLILGDTGTGKELIARGLHQLSARENENFCAINCAAIPDALLESELFGYEKGAFTGANGTKEGKIERANNGTLFLDEIGDMPLTLQAKLLRFLQERVVERLGGHKEIPVDVRIVCATHRNIEEMIKEGEFREDLYYRLSEIVMTIPPLKDREGDSIILSNAFLQRFNQQQGRSISGFTDDALKTIESYPWPGNIRELENKIKRAVIMAESNLITSDDLAIRIDSEEDAIPLNLREVRDAAEKKAISRALNNSGNNMAKAARLLGITRPTLYTMVSKYKLNV
ncbi:MAG: PEP-CTERM-box response regulator transcription factor [Moraxellaceae bacterium]|nr:MAG: PEP-CTERM-box response regulator transcription factor [Moraxellaceae bacterium]